MKFVLTEKRFGETKTRLNFVNFADLKNYLIKETTTYFGWINDNVDDPKDYRVLPNFENVETLREIQAIFDDFDYNEWSIEVEELVKPRKDYYHSKDLTLEELVVAKSVLVLIAGDTKNSHNLEALLDSVTILTGRINDIKDRLI